MKKVKDISVFFAVIIMSALLFTSCAKDESRYFTYQITSGDGISITGYTGKSTDITVPAEIDGFEVIKIAPGAFWGMTDVKTVSLPDSVTEIGDNAFYSCKNLVSFVVPQKLEKLGNNVFTECTELKTIKISGDSEFFSLVDGVLFYDSNRTLTLYPPKKQGTVYAIPDGVITIARNAFIGNTFLESVTFPDTLEEIGTTAFKKCESIKEIILPEGIKTIRASAFWQCSELSSITLPDSIETMGEQLFEGCPKLNSIYVVQGSYAHQWCKNNGKGASIKFY